MAKAEKKFEGKKDKETAKGGGMKGKSTSAPTQKLDSGKGVGGIKSVLEKAPTDKPGLYRGYFPASEGLELGASSGSTGGGETYED